MRRVVSVAAAVLGLLAWALPGLELLMEEPQRKADVWQAMRRLMARWKSNDE